jgi:hypothetical protein
MSSIIKGSRYTPATFRCPTNLLHSAVQWEQLRASYFKSKGEMARFQNCNTLVRSYENRIRDEAELPKQLS